MSLASHFHQTLETLRDTELDAAHAASVLADGKAKLAAIDGVMDKAYAEYLTTITLQADRNATEEFARTRGDYQKQTLQFLEALEQGQTAKAAQLRGDLMLPQWSKARAQINNIVELNQRH